MVKSAFCLISGDCDDRVQPSHSYKFIATLLQNSSDSENSFYHMWLKKRNSCTIGYVKNMKIKALMLGFILYHTGINYSAFIGNLNKEKKWLLFS